ncbi:hypothetical protein [Urbifossiella limnaea]|uniref:Translation initiation factor IF-2 n=1 Tax=Urbifossiella limnaea TaxID=2528023 RepID=A0A517XXE4_9BACT|nr:hypothetical protein [Urbifossiella limnaea]QDU22186.1 hypothetical protein ETAA1_41620 [Urbifossiella limnaea]
MRTTILSAAALLGLAATAAAQQPGGFPSGGLNYGVPGYPTFNPQNAMPNIYNPRTQPLSPYLNLMRGGSPGVNYYYGVRPGTTGGGATYGAGGSGGVGPRAGGFQFQYTPDDALLLPEPGEGYVLPPAGHPTVFNNTLGYFPSGPGAGGAGMGGQRPRSGNTPVQQPRAGRR